MATVTRNDPAFVETPPPTYTLELTEQEARELMFVMENLGGGGGSALRGYNREHTEPRLHGALGRAGVTGLRPAGGALYFSRHMT